MMENRWTQYYLILVNHSIKWIIVNFVLNYLTTVSKEKSLGWIKAFLSGRTEEVILNGKSS